MIGSAVCASSSTPSVEINLINLHLPYLLLQFLEKWSLSVVYLMNLLQINKMFCPFDLWLYQFLHYEIYGVCMCAFFKVFANCPLFLNLIYSLQLVWKIRFILSFEMTLDILAPGMNYSRELFYDFQLFSFKFYPNSQWNKQDSLYCTQTSLFWSQVWETFNKHEMSMHKFI